MRRPSIMGTCGSEVKIYMFDVVFSFIVLQHDLYEVTVDLAVGYTLDAALTHNPPFSVSVSTVMERGEKAERRTCTAQTDRQLFKHPNTESILGEQQERVVPFHEPHAGNKLKLLWFKVEFAE